MLGLVGAATIMGCLKYGASFSGFDDQDDPVLLFRLKDEDLLEAPDDSAFLQSLRFSCARVNGVYPPLALAEAFITEEDSAPRVRRLHLLVVDLHRRRRLADRVRRLFSDIQVDRCANECWNTLPIPWMPNQEAYQLLYAFGYAMDGSDLPCYMLWPTRTVEQSFWCIDAWKGDWIRLDKCSFIAPVGIEHFFDAFCLHPQRPWRAAACHALCIPSCQIAEDTLAWVSRCRYWYGWHLTIGLRGGVLHGGREHLRGWEGRVCFTLFHLGCKFPWQICLARALACVWVLLVFGWFCCLFLSSGEIWFQSHANSSCWPTMSRTCPAMQEKKPNCRGHPSGTFACE